MNTLVDISRWVGIPYVIRGELPAGLDCWGLVRAFNKTELGVELPDYLYEVAHNLEASRAYAEQARVGALPGWSSVQHPTIGDTLIFRIKGLPLHCGVYVGDGMFLHSLHTGQSSTIESLADVAWQRRLTGVYRYDQ